MTVKQARKILKENNIQWTNYFDLPLTRNFLVASAINRIKTFLTLGY